MLFYDVGMGKMDASRLSAENRAMSRQMVWRLRRQLCRTAKRLAVVAGVHPSTIEKRLALARGLGEGALQEKRRGLLVSACRKLGLTQALWIRRCVTAMRPGPVAKTVDDPKANTLRFLHKLQQAPNRVRSYFRHPLARCAACIEGWVDTRMSRAIAPSGGLYRLAATRHVLLAAIVLGLNLASGPVFSATNPPWQKGSVWQGRIGNQPVHVCFQDYGYSGAYYYDKYLRLISLDPDESRRTWRERLDGKEVWSIGRVSDTTMEVTWQQGNKTLHFELRRILPQTEKDRRKSACASQAFNAPRYATRPKLVRKDDPRRPFIDLSIDFGPALSKNYTYQSFLLRGNSPQARRINAYLLAEANRFINEDFPTCQGGALEMNAEDGEMEHLLSPPPTIIGGRFLQWGVQASDSCGGAHPNGGHYTQTWDMRTAKPVQFSRWFSPKAVVPEDSEQYIALTADSPLRPLLLAAYKQNSDCTSFALCRDLLADPNRTPEVSIGRDGLDFEFQIDVPRAMAFCSDTVSLSFKQLKPWLSTLGMEEMRALFGAK